MKNIFLISMIFLTLTSLSSQNGPEIKCTSDNFIFTIDTSQENYTLTQTRYGENTSDTIMRYWKDLLIINMMCSDTLIVLLRSSKDTVIPDFGTYSIKKINSEWHLNYDFLYGKNDWALAGRIYPDWEYRVTSDHKLLDINHFQWRETSMRGDGTDKQIWEYIDKLDFDTGEKTTISSIRIE